MKWRATPRLPYEGATKSRGTNRTSKTAVATKCDGCNRELIAAKKDRAYFIKGKTYCGDCYGNL